MTREIQRQQKREFVEAGPAEKPDGLRPAGPCWIENLDTGEVMPLGPMYGDKAYAQQKLERENLTYRWRVLDAVEAEAKRA